jgi:hypothetical protein
MSRRSILLPALLATTLSCLALPGQAQQAPAPEAEAARETLAKGSVFRVHGQEVRGVTNIVVAQVVNVLVDAQGRPQAAVLDYGGFLGVGRRRIAVVWSALSFGPEGIRLSISRDQMKNFPDYKEGEEVVIALPPRGPEPAAETPDAPAPETPAAEAPAPETPAAEAPPAAAAPADRAPPPAATPGPVPSAAPPAPAP